MLRVKQFNYLACNAKGGEIIMEQFNREDYDEGCIEMCTQNGIEEDGV